MIIMPSNNTGRVVKDLFKKHPNKIALLLNPRNITPHQLQFKYAVDNDCYTKFDSVMYFSQLIKIRAMYENGLIDKPMWVVVPDVVGCNDRTQVLWQFYYPKIKPFGFKLAFVAQDGCELEGVPKEADIVFVGGRDPWKMDNIHKFIGDRPVHVGRVNGIGRLAYCESLGVDSVDGTGWLVQRGKQYNDFIRFFEGEKQCSLL